MHPLCEHHGRAWCWCRQPSSGSRRPGHTPAPMEPFQSLNNSWHCWPQASCPAGEITVEGKGNLRRRNHPRPWHVLRAMPLPARQPICPRAASPCAASPAEDAGSQPSGPICAPGPSTCTAGTGGRQWPCPELPLAPSWLPGGECEAELLAAVGSGRESSQQHGWVSPARH